MIAQEEEVKDLEEILWDLEGILDLDEMIVDSVVWVRVREEIPVDSEVGTDF